MASNAVGCFGSGPQRVAMRCQFTSAVLRASIDMPGGGWLNMVWVFGGGGEKLEANGSST
jgi:hypothetical protein